MVKHCFSSDLWSRDLFSGSQPASATDELRSLVPWTDTGAEPNGHSQPSQRMQNSKSCWGFPDSLWILLARLSSLQVVAQADHCECFYLQRCVAELTIKLGGSRPQQRSTVVMSLVFALWIGLAG